MASLLPRLLLALVVVALLGRAGRAAWHQRHLAVAVWRAVRPRHVLGSLALLTALLLATVTMVTAVPVLGVGLGDLLSTDGNAVLAPVGVAAEVTGVGTDASTGIGDALFLLGLSGFLLLLGAMLPWFAFVEEEVFRAGAEAWSLPRRVAAALVFGAAHLVMLVPVAAALSIAVAGFVYGEVYRRGWRRGAPAPTPLVTAFRPTRRSRAAALAAAGPVVAGDDLGAASRAHVRRQVAGLHASTVWHTTFNTLVLLLVWFAFSVEAWGT